MLSRLFISNYVIIDQLELVFPGGLTVITGETGAGKSIVMEALLLALGERAETGIMADPHKKCVIEAEFHAPHLAGLELIEEYDVGSDATLLIRREINAAGKSRFFLNDTPVTAQTLRQLATYLVNMHQQNDVLQVGQTNFQLAVLDILSNQEALARSYRSQYSAYRKATEQWQQRLAQQLEAAQELDYLSYQLAELEAAQMKSGEQEALEQEEKQLTHASELQRIVHEAEFQLASADLAILTQLKSLAATLRSVAGLLPALDALYDRLQSVVLELEDIARDLQSMTDTIPNDADRLQFVQERLSVLYRLQKKHHVANTEALLQLKDTWKQKILTIQSQDHDLEQLRNTLRQQEHALCQLAQQLSQNRKQYAAQAVDMLNSLLAQVGMPQAKLQLQHDVLPPDQLSVNGIDVIRFLFSPNPGSAFQEINKVASGGELSRLMLCFQSLLASSAELPTLIFDEIDIGISGETAHSVARLLHRLSRRHQVICITHLPQVAAKGDQHLYVTKETSAGRTRAHVRWLDGEENLHAIARMIAGTNITEAALASARELLN